MYTGVEDLGLAGLRSRCSGRRERVRLVACEGAFLLVKERGAGVGGSRFRSAPGLVAPDICACFLLLDWSGARAGHDFTGWWVSRFVCSLKLPMLPGRMNSDDECLFVSGSLGMRWALPSPPLLLKRRATPNMDDGSPRSTPESDSVMNSAVDHRRSTRAVSYPSSVPLIDPAILASTGSLKADDFRELVRSTLSSQPVPSRLLSSNAGLRS